MQKRLDNSHYVVFGLVLLVLVMGVVSFVRSDAVANVRGIQGISYVGHDISEIVGAGDAPLDTNNDRIIDHANYADQAVTAGIAAKGLLLDVTDAQGKSGANTVDASIVGNNIRLTSTKPIIVDGLTEEGLLQIARKINSWNEQWPCGQGSDYCASNDDCVLYAKCISNICYRACALGYNCINRECV